MLQKLPCSWCISWRLTLPTYVLHPHTHTIACLGLKCLNIPPLCRKKKKSKWALYAHNGNKVADKESEWFSSLVWQPIPAALFTKATLRPCSCTKTFFYHRGIVLYWSPISNKKTLFLSLMECTRLHFFVNNQWIWGVPFKPLFDASMDLI